MSYLLSNNASFPQSYAPANFEYPSNGNSSWDSYVASHTNSLGDAYNNNMGGYDYDDYGLMPQAPLAHMNANKHYGSRAYTKKKRAGSKGKKAKSPAKAKVAVAKKAATGVAKAAAVIAKDVKIVKKALSPKRSPSPKRRSPRKSKSPAKRYKGVPRAQRVKPQAKRAPRKVATKKSPGHFGLRGKGGYNQQMARAARQASAVKYFTPAALKLYERVKKTRVHKGPQGYRHVTPNQMMYRELVKELRPQGLSMKQIGNRWRQMQGGHRQGGVRSYYKNKFFAGGAVSPSRHPHMAKAI